MKHQCICIHIRLLFDTVHISIVVYHTRRYMDIVKQQAMCSMERAIIECRQEKEGAEVSIQDVVPHTYVLVCTQLLCTFNVIFVVGHMRCTP